MSVQMMHPPVTWWTHRIVVSVRRFTLTQMLKTVHALFLPSKVRLHGIMGAILALASCVQKRPDVADQVPFAGVKCAPAGSGVDLSLHKPVVSANPRSNPRQAWDSTTVFTIMGHGLHVPGQGPVTVDERSSPSRHLSPRALVAEIHRDPKADAAYHQSDVIVLFACGAGTATRDGDSSFAKRLAVLTGKPVVAPSDTLIMSGGRGTVREGGRFIVLNP